MSPSVNRDLIMTKSAAVRKHISRIKDASDISLDQFLGDEDRQDIVMFNLQLTILNCIYIAAHIVSKADSGVPGVASELFYILEEKNYIDQVLANHMAKSVGLRNLIVHEYSRLDLEMIYDISHNSLTHLETFLKIVLNTI